MEKLVVKNLSKSFGSVKANQHVDLTVESGEVHAILGENGAGKTTLMKCIYGLHKIDEGEIYYEGESMENHSVSDSIKKGIGMVHQHFMLVHNMNAAENVMIGLEDIGKVFINQKSVEARLSEIMDKYHLHVDMNCQIQNMSVGAQQRVEILKALYRQSSLLILDEPTAVLTPQEIEDLFRFIEEYIRQDNSVVLITHKLDEIMKIADRITVMRAGVKTGTFRKTDIKDKKELAEKMMGESIEWDIKRKVNTEGLEKVLEVKDLVVRDNRGLNALNGVSFDLHKGEILGVAGVSGNGQTELAEALAGLRPIHEGEIFYDGENIANMSPRKIQEMQIRYIPEDRHRVGLILDYSLRDNYMLGKFYAEPSSHGLRLDHKYNNDMSEKLLKEYNVMATDIWQKARTLSGGNQQKIILGRELSAEPRILISTQATRGLDIASTIFVQQCIMEQKEKGTGILYISTELDEIMEICDRVVVFYEGRIIKTFMTGELDKWQIGLLMAGNKDHQSMSCKREKGNENTREV